MTDAEATPARVRAPRSDARDNHQRILRAAAEAFDEHGVDVRMTEVAARAEVAIGTVYRHFPTKEALVDALLLDRLTDTAAAAREAAAGATEPWAALEAFLRVVAARQVADRSLAQFIGGRIPGSAELRDLLHDLFDTFGSLVEDAQRAGRLRTDVAANDIRMAMICVSRAIWADWPDPDWVLQRYLALVLDGLRAPGHTALGGTPPAPDFAARAASPSRPAPFTPGRRRWSR